MNREDLPAIDVFFSYAHQDEELRDGLAEHLRLLEREGKIRAWHDRKILAGESWPDEIDERLEDSDLILLLVSSSFIASPFCWEVELKRALERDAAGEAAVVPILLRPCDWQTAPFGKLQALPKDALPITEWSNRDSAFLDVAQGLRRRVDAMIERRKATPADTDPAPNPGATVAQELKEAVRRKVLLESQGEDTAAQIETILGLKRRLREGFRLRPGDHLVDRFELLEPLGSGGFARVWKAYDTERQSVVAVKVLHPQYAGDSTRRERFFRGAHYMARLRHPGIVDVLDQEFEDGGLWFFVMDHLPGGDLRQAVLAGRLPLDERFNLILEVGDALAFAHRQGIVHRDVKPANILLDLEGRPHLTDFDLVRAVDTTGGTRTSSMLGTFLYAAPESMLDASRATPAADVYGLGMTALFTLHGADLPADILWELPDFLAALDVDEACRQVLTKAVERRVEERYATVEAFCDALRRALESPSRLEIRPPAIMAGENGPTVREWANERLGMEFVFVPGGEYTLGTDNSDNDSRPLHTVKLSPFWIGKFPVTNAQYKRFLRANPDQPKPEYWTDERFNDPRQPVVGVSWQQAVAFCRWAGVELPTEAQWEAAARGADRRRFPWGKTDPSSELANFGRNEGRPTPVGSYPKGSGPFGTLDQAGNVWEWCRDLWDKDAYDGRDGMVNPVSSGKEDEESAFRVVRGGSWGIPSRLLVAAIRFWLQAGHRGRVLGFRVVSVSVPEHDS